MIEISLPFVVLRDGVVTAEVGALPPSVVIEDWTEVDSTAEEADLGSS